MKYIIDLSSNAVIHLIVCMDLIEQSFRNNKSVPV